MPVATTEMQAADQALNQAAKIAMERAGQLLVGEGMVEALAQTIYNQKAANVAAAAKIQIGKQFDIPAFLKEVGRFRLRRLPVITLPLTTAAGVHQVAEFNIEAPSDRHQLVLNPLFEITGVVAAGVVQYPDFTQLSTLGVLDVRRPQGDTTQENFADFLTGGNQLEIDDVVVDIADRFIMENREFQLIRAMPWGVDHAISNSFAFLPKLNTLTLSINNLAAAGAVTPSATQLFASLHTYVIDCILGGN